MFKKQAEMAEVSRLILLVERRSLFVGAMDLENFEDEILSAFVAQVYTPIRFEPLCL
jgi:hypothetical protein